VSNLFKKRSTLRRRLKRVRKELSEVSGDIRVLSRDASAPAESEEPGPADSRRDPDRGQGVIGENGVSRDTRFVSYLMSRDFDSPPRPLRHERRIQRNKAVVMSIFALVVLLWVVFRFFV